MRWWEAYTVRERAEFVQWVFGATM